MKKEQLKPIIAYFLKKMMGEWFSDKPIWRVLGLSLIDANINKYDNIIDMFADENDNIDVEGVLNNLTSAIEDSFKIDLQQFSPLLPNRILLISKDDIKSLLATIYEKQNNEP